MVNVVSAANPSRILYIAEACALNVANGSQVRCLNVIRALQEIGKVEVVALSDPLDGVQADLQTGSRFTLGYTLRTQPRPNEGLVAKFKWTFNPKTPYPRGYGVSEEGLRRISRSAKEFDLIWLFKQRCAGLFPDLTWPRSVLDIDDVLSRYERAALGTAGTPLERLLTFRRMVSWRRRERLLGTRFRVLSVCSEEDEEYLRRLGVDAPIHVIPNAFESPRQEPVRCLATPPRVGFIGPLDYFPNHQGIEWFANKCWPHIKREIPEARLRLVGTGTDGPLKPSGPDVDGLGWLEVPADEIQTWSVMVVPIRMGAGTRVKIVHGFSRKCPIVSTSVGAHGYDVADGRELYLADSPEQFSSACIKAVREPKQAAEMADRAWREFLEKWTWEAVRPRVWAAAEDCLRSSPESPSVSQQTRLY
jgi:glycosyltransferase involved in cell wall biosynthesis